MKDENIILLISFNEDESEMASIRWRRFKKYLERKNFRINWVTVKFPHIAKGKTILRKITYEIKLLNFSFKLSKRLEKSEIFKKNIVVLATIPVLDPLLVGFILKIRSKGKIKLILEIRDIYARTDLYNFNKIRRNIEILKESFYIKFVDKILYLTDEIKKHYCSYYKNLKNVKEGITITNGYDRDEYIQNKKVLKTKNFLEINYFGSFSGTRNPEILYKSLKKLKDNGNTNLEKIKINIFGKVEDYPLEMKIHQYGLNGTVLYHGEKSHDFILRRYLISDINLIITHRKGSYYALPGKLFEYIGSGRPVWAITNDQILIDFIKRHKLGFVCNHTVENVIKTLEVIIFRYENRRLHAINIPKKFDTEQIVKKLERVLY